jgi:hypothetical protein
MRPLSLIVYVPMCVRVYASFSLVPVLNLFNFHVGSLGFPTNSSFPIFSAVWAW